MAGVAGWSFQGDISNRSAIKPSRMLLAPMIGIIEPCVMAQKTDGQPMQDLVQACTDAQGSAAALVESTLSALQPQGTAPGRYELGYTLPIPLLQLFRRDATGWTIDKEMVDRLVRTVRDSNRPLIMYLFSTHFAADAPIETELARDPVNLGQTRDGPLPQDTYYASKINNWTFASTQNDITARRVEAIQAVLAEVCRLEPHHIAKIRGVTLLGELHHLFPNFQAGMGFDAPYRVTDYSPHSVTAFRVYLQQEFKDIAALNRATSGDYTSFDEVEPPSRDIRTEPLKRYAEHIDSFAHGSLPIAGWAFVDKAQDQPPLVHIYRNGEWIGKTQARLGRQDVLQAKPQFGAANTGWRFDMNFKTLPSGLHRIDVFLEQKPGALIHLGTRNIAIMDRQQRTPTELPQRALPIAQQAPDTQAHIDHPVDQSSYYYNPLVPLWHAFRGQQVVRYLKYFDGVMNHSCLGQTPRYTHQIMPFTNPSWDENKFAIQASLLKMGSVRLGVSLYGEPAYGPSFAEWYAKTRRSGYGVTEFHPLKAMDTRAMQHMLEQHAQRGAEFLSFFAEPYWHGELVPRGHNIFSFDPNNPQFGSATLYRSVQQALNPTTATTSLQPNTSAAPSAIP